MIFILEELNSYSFEIPDVVFDEALYFSDKVLATKATLCYEGMALVITIKDEFRNRIDYVYSLIAGKDLKDENIFVAWNEKKEKLEKYDLMLAQSRKENNKPISMLLN